MKRFAKHLAVLCMALLVVPVLVACGSNGATAYTVTIDVAGGESSWVTVMNGETPVVSGNKYDKNSELKITVTPSATHTIKSVKAGSTNLTAAEGVYTHILTKDITIEVRFEEKKTEPEPDAKAYLGVYQMVLPNIKADVTSEMSGSSIEIDTTNEEIILIRPDEEGVLGAPQVFSYTMEGPDTFVVSELTIDMIVVREGTKLNVDLTAVDDDGVETVTILEFELDSGDLYLLTDARMVIEGGCVTLELKAEGVLNASIIIAVLEDDIFVGFYTVDEENVISLFKDEENLIFVGTIVNDNAIEIDLSEEDNEMAAAMVALMGIETDGDILTIYKLVA